MHAIKCGSVGQTFALAKCNESGGKKSRIRRSKEERKALIESFIQKYQKLNNGTFPSLTLTHKEVGGSFYTVRELVREAIQENRVLGPAKLTSDQNLDVFLEQSPLGSISIEPEVGLSSPNGSHIVTHLVPTAQQDEIVELVLDSSVHCPESKYQRFDEGPNVNEGPTETMESKAKVMHPHKAASEELVSKHQKFDDGKRINGSSQIVEKTEEYDESSYTESLPAETLQLDENVAELEVSKGGLVPVATYVMLERFPLRSDTKVAHGLDENYSEQSDLSQAVVQEEIGRVELAEINNSSVVADMNVSESTSDLQNEKAMENLAGRPLLENGCGLVDEKPVDNLEAPVLENLNNYTTREGAILETQNDRRSEVDDVSHAGTEVVMDATVDMDTQSLNGTIGSSISLEQSISQKVPSKSNPNPKLKVKNCSISPNESNLTLDRMNLESWETLEKPGDPETNPFLLFIKSSIDAFVKFWSE